MATLDHELGEPLRDGPPSRRWRRHLFWSGLLLVGLLVYEVTAQPGLGVAVACTKFGWNDFLTARWLWRIDPNRRRARACGLLYLASGFWKIALTGFAVIWIVAMVDHPGRQQKPAAAGPPPEFIGAGIATLVGFGTSTLLTCAALLSAWRNRIKLWLGLGVHGARREDVWPSLYQPVYTRANHAHGVILTALVLAYVVGSLLLGLAVFAALRPANADGITFMVLGLAFIFVGPVLLLWLNDALQRRVIASTPAECWGTWEAEEWLRRTRPEVDEHDSYTAFPEDG
jgi:hypothetical protein